MASERVQSLSWAAFGLLVAIGVPTLLIQGAAWVTRQPAGPTVASLVFSALLMLFGAWSLVVQWRSRLGPPPAHGDASSRFVERQGILMGLPLLLPGAWLVQHGLASGRYYEQFEGGTVVRAIVQRTYDAGGRTFRPDLRADIVWRDTAGRMHPGHVCVTKVDLETLRPGHGMNVIMSRNDPSSFITTQALEHEGYCRIAGRPLTTYTALGAPLASLGMLLAGRGVVGYFAGGGQSSDVVRARRK